jgi:transposase
VLTIPPSVKLWYAPQPVDFRLGFDGLAALVSSRLAADPYSGHLFIFRNRTGDRVKVLYWGRHGLCLWSQRLEAGRYHFPDPPQEGAAGIELTPAQFAMVLDGIDLTQVRRFKRLAPPVPPAPNAPAPLAR